MIVLVFDIENSQTRCLSDLINVANNIPNCKVSALD